MPENLQISSRHHTVDSEYLGNYYSRNNENYKTKAMHGKVIPSFMITKVHKTKGEKICHEPTGKNKLETLSNKREKIRNTIHPSSPLKYQKNLSK